jgi:CubicO group peptidase (beta-lactamase class C family)/pimeloyl-ACP methyl ester carboxylesterase
MRNYIAGFLICWMGLFCVAQASRAPTPAPSTEDQIQALLPELEAYIAKGMKGFDVPGLAIGIVADDKLVYAKGFGVRSKSSGLPVDTRTIFQIGSTTKAFLTTTMAIMVDRNKLRWDDRVIDLDPEFQMKDPWVTREFRVFDLPAQRSGLPPLVNDTLGMFDFSEAALIHSLRDVEPVSSFRTTFAYTNITHLEAGRIVAKAAGAPDWNAVLQKELLDPLGMKESSYTVEGIAGAANHANGHRWTPQGTIEVPFTAIFPYHLGASGDINSNIEDMARWVRLQLGNGTFEGRRIVSAEGLAFTRRPKVALNDKMSYAMGWYNYQTPNGAIIWHDGDAISFGSFVGTVPDRKIGILILTNETNAGLPDSLGHWLLERLLGQIPKDDYVANKLKEAKADFEQKAKMFAKPANPRPFPPVEPLAGNFSNPSFGEVAVTLQGDALVMAFQATGARLKLEPWDGDVFLAKLMPTGQFGPIVDLGYMTEGFVQFQMDADGKLGLLRLSTEYSQAYEFQRKAAGQAAVSGDFTGLIDIDGDRKMYLECRGTGFPSVVLVAGLKASAEDWKIAKSEPTVFAEVAKFTQVCTYDRPGTPVGEKPSRSDPVRQPTTAEDAAADLHALLGAAGVARPIVLVGHSYGGLVARLYASIYPEDVSGLVLVDALTEGLRDAETAEQWAIQRRLMEGEIRDSLVLYPALERVDPDRSFDEMRTAPPLRPIPLVVLSADRGWGPQVPSMIAAGILPAETSPDFGYVTDAAQRQAQDRLAKLVPNAKHIVNTNSGHEIHKEQPQLVIDSIREVVRAIRSGSRQLAR